MSFMRHVLGLVGTTEVTVALQDALRVLVELTDAAVGYAEVQGDRVFARGFARHGDGAVRVVTHREALTRTAQDCMERGLFTATGSFAAHPKDRAVIAVPIDAELPIIGAVLLSRRIGDTITTQDHDLLGLLAAAIGTVAPKLCRAPLSLADQVRELEQRRIREVLARCDGNESETARILKVSRTFLRSRLHGRLGRKKKRVMGL